MRYSKHYKRKTSRFKTSKKGRKIKAYEQLIINFIAVFLIVCFFVFLYNLLNKPQIKSANFSSETVSAFAIPNKTMIDLKALSEKYSIDFPELLTIYSFENNFFKVKKEALTIVELEQNLIINYDKIKDSYTAKKTEPYIKMFRAIIDDTTYFPIPLKYDLEERESYMYGDNWAQSKGTGSDVVFGTDIFDRENIAGRIPIVSCSDGTVTKVNSNDTDGGTVSIETTSGVTYTYAHLNAIEPLITKGTKLKAGNLIGFMGNSGNRLNTAARLRLSITVKTTLSSKPFEINPYPFLRLKETSKVEYVPKV